MMLKKEACYVHLRTTQTVKLRVLFETLNPILIDSNIYFVETGLKMETIADTMFVCLSLSNFEEYHCSEKKVVGVNFANLYSYLKRVGQDDVITIQLSKEAYDSSCPYFTIFISNDHAGYRFQHKVNLLDIAKEELEIPEKTFDTFVDLPSQLLLKILRSCEEQGEHLQILTRGSRRFATKGYVYFMTSNEMNSSMIRQSFMIPRKIAHEPGTKVKQLDDGTIGRECDKRDKFSLRHLLLMSKACGMSKSVRMYLSNDYALVMQFNVGTLGHVTFCLAQNVDSGGLALGEVKDDDSDDAKDEDGKENDDDIVDEIEDETNVVPLAPLPKTRLPLKMKWVKPTKRKEPSEQAPKSRKRARPVSRLFRKV